jgi:hypothetical protein
MWLHLENKFKVQYFKAIYWVFRKIIKKNRIKRMKNYSFNSFSKKDMSTFSANKSPN